MMWLMENLRIYLEEQPLINYCVIKHLILQKIQKGYQGGLASMVCNFFSAPSAWSETLITRNEFAGGAVKS